MLIRKKPDMTYSQVTPKQWVLNRRDFLAGAAAAGTVLYTAPKLWRQWQAGPVQAQTKLPGVTRWPQSTSEKQTPFKDATTYNNYYEFGTAKDEPAVYARGFKTSPWSVSVEGEVKKPRKITMDEILKVAPLEERIYRLRCVEAWSMVIPWIGYPFSALANLVEPTPKAKYVAFETFYSPQQMPRGIYAGIELPYVEGLRLDEAMHPLTLLTVGMYGETLPPQNGAPVRIVVPWKYGFKSIKSLVRIRFTQNQPPTTWAITNPREYGFYSNVNPQVDHPRWSQARERRIGEFLKRETLMFNGYGDQVAGLYAGMDLRKNF